MKAKQLPALPEKPIWKVPQNPQGNSVTYKVLHNDKVIENYNFIREACFYQLTMSGIPQEATSIVVSVFLDHSPYTKEQIIQWLAAMNDDFGFPVEYGDEKDGVIKVSVDLSKYDNNKIKVFSALTLIRYLWEQGQSKVPGIYFYLLAHLPEEDKVALMLHAHNCLKKYTLYTGRHYGSDYANSGHMLRDEEVRTLYTKEEMEDRLKRYKKPMFDSNFVSFLNVFQGEMYPHDNYPIPTYKGDVISMYKDVQQFKQSKEKK